MTTTPAARRRLPARAPLALATLFALTLAACGGGDDTAAAPSPTPPSPPSAPTPPAPAPAATTLQGVAASGAAFTGATVTATDSRGIVVATSTTPVGDTGAYQLTLAAGAVAPIVLTATRTTADDAVETLVSVRPTATSGTVNLTPLTTLVASRLSASGNPNTLAADVKASPATASEAAVAAKVAEVRQIVAPVMAATGTTAVDLLNGAFAVDGTGQDRLLDAITVNIIPAGAATANVEVGLKVRGADGAQPPVIRFTNNDNLAAIQAANAAVLATQIDEATLVASGTNVLIQQFLARLTACHAVPLAERSATGTSGVTITAEACRRLFLGDDPAAYLSDGLRIVPGGALPSLITAAGTGLVFGQGTYEFSRTNGDFVIGYTSRSPAGAEEMDTLVVRRVGETLKLVGNQHVFPGRVYPFMQNRRFTANDPGVYDYRSTGYVTQVTNRVDTATGLPIFDRVEVVTPAGATLVLKPTPASQTLVLAQDGRLSNTSYVRLRAVFDNPATAGRPGDQESKDMFFLAEDLSDAALTGIPAQSVWTYRYYLAANPTVVAATQYFRTRARALTIPEFRTLPLADFDTATVTALRGASASGGLVPIGGKASVDVAWNVATGAIPPTQVVMFGNVVVGSSVQVFNDYTDVTSIARSASLPCVSASAGDAHCTGASPRVYAGTARATGLYLLARERTGREYASYWATYRMPVPR